MTALSLVSLLWVGAVVVRLHTWGSERTLVSVTAPAPFYVPRATPQVEASGLADIYAAVTLPELPTHAVASSPRRPSRAPAIEFMRVNKEVLILEEAFAPGAHETDLDGEWRPIQGSTSVRTNEPVELSAVAIESVESTNFVALFEANQLPTEVETMVAESPEKAPVTDSVSTVLAKAEASDVEPEFFAYGVKEKTAPPGEVELAAVTVEPQVPSAPNEYSNPEGWDLPVGTQSKLAEANNVEKEEITAFSYVSPKGVPTKTLPRAPAVANHSKSPVVAMVDSQAREREKADREEGMDSQQSLADGMATAQVTLAPVSVDRTKTSSLRNFEIRAKDDDGENWEDHGEGKVVWKEEVAPGTQSRGIVVLHLDHVPTHADIPLLAGRGELEIPVFTREKLAAFARSPRSVPVGHLLVDLDENTEDVQVDGSSPIATRLTQDFVPTKGEDFRYVLFSGVEAGNRTLTAVRSDGRRSHRLLHVHEEEVTFEPGLFVGDEGLAVTLKGEDVLSQEKTPLVMPSDRARLFFEGTPAQKTAPDRYTFRPAPRFLGARHYLALSHLGEEVYAGVDKSGEVDVPSEELMREVIRRFKLGGGSQACVVQVNLDRPAKRYQVLAESHDESHVSFGLVLDRDGKFYDSMGEGSRRLFLMSESQGSGKQSQNARLNIRLEYQDGSFRSFQSYCSPHSYLVEQL